jgi:hypothetical protein
VGPQASERLTAALLTFFESAERGAPVDRDVLPAEYPDVSHELRDFLDAYAFVGRVAAPLREAVHAMAGR